MKPFHDLHKRIKQEEIKDMNLRDYFAAKAMQSFLVGCNDVEDNYVEGGIAIQAYNMADAMMEARNV